MCLNVLLAHACLRYAHLPRKESFSNVSSSTAMIRCVSTGFESIVPAATGLSLG